MDCDKIGNLIYNLRKEKAMTQKQLADLMNISDKAISKWERGLGCPDVSLLPELSQILGVNIEEILSGKIELNETIRGNMKKLNFYVCPQCNNLMTATGDAHISCCGKRLEALVAAKSEDNHLLNIEPVENELYVSSSHEMKKILLALLLSHAASALLSGHMICCLSHIRRCQRESGFLPAT